MARTGEKAKDEMMQTLKVRHFIMNIIYRSGFSSVMIPSSRQLAAQFGIARSTVQLALEKLQEDGYLFSRAGIGTFTNPVSGLSGPGECQMPLIGVIWGDGKSFLYSRYMCRQIAPISLALTDSGCNMRFISLGANTSAAIVDELRHDYLDGVIAILPERLGEETLARLDDAIPLVAIRHDVGYETIATVISDYCQAGAELARQLLAERRRKILFAVSEHHMYGNLAGFRQHYAESGVKWEEAVIADRADTFFDDFNRYLATHDAPEVVFIHGRDADMAMKALRRHGLDVMERCRVVALRSVAPGQDFHGLVFEEDHEAVAAAANALMGRRLRGERHDGKNRVVPVTVRMLSQSGSEQLFNIKETV